MSPETLKAALDAIEAGDAAKAIEILKGAITEAATGGEAPPPATEGEALADNPDPPPAEEDDAAALSMLRTLTGKASAAEAVAMFGSFMQRFESFDRDRQTVELAERRGLIADLVKLGVELPAHAWEGDPAKLVPAKRLAEEPIASLRDRVASHKKVKPGARLEAPETDADEDPVKKLSARELAACKKQGLEPAEYVARKAAAARRH